MASPGTAYGLESSPQHLEDFLRAELDFGLTLADMAAHQDPQAGEHFARRKRNAETAVSTIHGLMHLLGNNRAKAEIQMRCSELERLLATL
jgi:hypothetical protein